MKLVVATFAALTLLASFAQADELTDKGGQVFKKCAACHSIKDKANRVGPSLMGLVGRKIGAAEGYAYSDGMKELGATGAIWDEATLGKYLEAPKTMVPKTKMSFSGLPKQEDRDALIAFLKTKM